MLVACSAGEGDLGVSQEAVCSSAPICTGTVGSAIKRSTNYFIMSPVPGEPYSAQVSTPNGSGQVHWGSTSDIAFRTTGCAGTPCAAWPTGAVTLLKLENINGSGAPDGVRIIVNGVKVAELTNCANSSSLQSPTTFSGGLMRIRQDTGLNSVLYFEGYDAGVWKSRTGRFSNACGGID